MIPVVVNLAGNVIKRLHMGRRRMVVDHARMRRGCIMIMAVISKLMGSIVIIILVSVVIGI